MNKKSRLPFTFYDDSITVIISYLGCDGEVWKKICYDCEQELY